MIRNLRLGAFRGLSSPSTTVIAARDASRPGSDHDRPRLSQSLGRLSSPYGHGGLAWAPALAGVSLRRHGVLRGHRYRAGPVDPVLFARLPNRDGRGHLEVLNELKAYASRMLN